MQVNTFEDWFELVQEKAGMRLDKMAARYCYDCDMGVMDAVLALVNRR